MLVPWAKTKPSLPRSSPPTHGQLAFRFWSPQVRGQASPPTAVIAASFLRALWRAESRQPCCSSFQLGSDQNSSLWKSCFGCKSCRSCSRFKKRSAAPPTSPQSLVPTCQSAAFPQRLWRDSSLIIVPTWNVKIKLTWKPCFPGAGKHLWEGWRPRRRTVPGNL